MRYSEYKADALSMKEIGKATPILRVREGVAASESRFQGRSHKTNS